MKSVEFFSPSPRSRKRPERSAEESIDPAETHPYVPPAYRNLDSRTIAALRSLSELDAKLEKEKTHNGRLLILAEFKSSLSLIFALVNDVQTQQLHRDFAERLANLEIFLKTSGEVYSDDKAFRKFVDAHKELKAFLQPFIDQRPNPLAEALKDVEVKRRLF